ncbi:MAG: AAA family ATPase [Sphingorhabdus sp.]
MTLPAPFRAVITGGPGTGKSTLLQALAATGLQTFPEVARTILKAPGGMAMRAERPAEFAVAMLKAQCDAWHAAEPGLSVYDRGFADIAGYLKLEALPIPDELEQACRHRHYQGPVFRAPPWREIYTGDEERIQTWEEALAGDAAVTAAWKHYGYRLIDLPFVPVTGRVAFVMEQLQPSLASLHL